jgi:hypothetical protein
VLAKHRFPRNADELRDEMDALVATLEPGAAALSRPGAPLGVEAGRRPA